MPTKKRKYNARFPAGRIKKIMQTDEEVGKVAQAVPIIISRTLELFVESLLGKAMQVTMARNAKTLSPSHVKQCILAESRFDFLKDLVKNIPDVSAAEEKEMMSAESSPNSSRFSEMPRRITKDDSNSSNSCEIKFRIAHPPPISREHLKRTFSDPDPRQHKTGSVPCTIVSETAIDLSKKIEEPTPIIQRPNFYQETLPEVPHQSVITVNPTYSSPQPSTSYTNLTPVEPIHKVEVKVPKPPRDPFADIKYAPRTPVTPILNIDFTKGLAKPEIKVLDSTVPLTMKNDKIGRTIQRQNSKPHKVEIKKYDVKTFVPQPIDVDGLNSGNLQIDEDYDT